MYKKRQRQKTFQNCRLFKPLTIVTDLYTYMWSSDGQNMGMTSYPIIYLDLAAYVSDDDDDPKMFFKSAKNRVCSN